MRGPSRLRLLLGPLEPLLTPAGALAGCALGWALSAPFSSNPWAMGLCWWGVALTLWSVQLERPWLEVLPFPPLTVLALHLFLRWELGGMLLLLVREAEGDVEVWVQHVAQALPINALFTTGLVAAAVVNRAWLRSRPLPDPAGEPTHPMEAGFGRRQLLLLTALTGCVAISFPIVGLLSGTLDRGAAYMEWAGRFWRPDMLLVSLIRLRDLYFILLPWLLWRWRHSARVVVLFLVPTALSLLASAILGGRGLLLYPTLLLLGGCWLAGCRPILLRWVLLASALAALLLVAVTPVVRRTMAFQQSSATDVGGRVAAIETGLRQVKPASTLSLVGRDLYAWSDPYLFKEPGLSLPPAGNKRLAHLLYLWIPRAMMPERPELNDGHLIAKEIIGDPQIGTHQGRHVWFPGISMGADLYWRYRWPGVIIGSLFFGLAYAAFCRFWYRFANLNQNNTSVLIALFPSTFLQGPPLRSVLETAWNWLYEFPKYLVVCIVMCLLINAINHFAQPPQPAAKN